MSRVQIAVTFMDDSERFFPVPEGGSWTIRREVDVPMLIVGGLPPRVEIPLANVRYYGVEPLPQAAAGYRCRAVMVRQGAPGVDIRCDFPPHPGSPRHMGYDPSGNELRWLDPPDPAEVEGVVQWAEQQAQADRCNASVRQRGRSWRCDSRAGHHPADGHVNRTAELVWWAAVSDEATT